MAASNAQASCPSEAAFETQNRLDTQAFTANAPRQYAPSISLSTFSPSPLASPSPHPITATLLGDITSTACHGQLEWGTADEDG